VRLLLPFRRDDDSDLARIAQSVSTLAAGEILGRLVAFAATAILARRLGPEGFGVLGFALALSGFLRLVVDAGLGEIGMREVARGAARTASTYSSVTSMRLLLAAGAFLLLALVALVLPKPATTQWVVLLSGLSFFSFAVDPAWVFKGLERPAAAGVDLVLALAVYGVAVFLLVGGPADVTRVPVLQFAGEVAAILIVLPLLKGVRLRFSPAAGMAMWREAGYLGIARVLRTVVVSADVVMLGFLSTDRNVGLYSAAYRVLFLLMSIAGAVSVAHLPTYSRVVHQGAEATRRLLADSLATAATVGAPLVAGVIVTAPGLLAALFGAEYAEAATALRLLAVSIGIVFLHWTLTNLLVAANRTRLQAFIQGGAALLNVALNLILIPRFGIEGSAAATLAAEGLVGVAAVVVMRRMNVLPSLGPVVPPVAAALVMSFAVWLAIGTLPLAVQVALGGVVYAGALTGLKRL
jgi:O-antigen/teichoic acid export membrane protein